MKILLHLLVLSSLSSVIFGLAINQGQINVVQYQELAIINDSAPKAARLIDWTSSTNSPVTRGNNIVLTLRGLSQADETLDLVLKLNIETASHVPIKEAEANLKFLPHNSLLVTWTIPPEWYVDILGSENEVVFSAYVGIEGKTEIWTTKEVVQVN